MASDQQFCLRWNNHQSTLVSVFDNLLESQTLVDCTLAADGQYLKAHKVVLSACSPYLEAILCQNLDKHPILILKDVKFSELKAMLDYMYRGEVNISQEQLSTFLKAAESLQIKGLTDSGGGGSSDREREPLKRQDLRKPLNQPVPHIPQPRPVVPHPGLMERRSLPHFPPHIADMQPQSPRHAREGSTSPTARKRRRPNRPSSDDSNFVSTPNSLSENQPDTSDSCDVPVKQAASSTPNVPNATTKAPETDSNRTTPQPQNNQQNSEQKQQVSVKKEFSETLLTPKTEFDYGNDNSMEDVTYEDDEEEEVDLSKPGTSFAANSQGFPPWQMGGDGSNDDSNNMYSPDVTAATNQNNSQGHMNSVTESPTIENANVTRKKKTGNNFIQSPLEAVSNISLGSTILFRVWLGNSDKPTMLEKYEDENNTDEDKIKIRGDLFDTQTSETNINSQEGTGVINNQSHDTEVKSEIKFEPKNEDLSCDTNDDLLDGSTNEHNSLVSQNATNHNCNADYSTVEKSFGLESCQGTEEGNVPAEVMKTVITNSELENNFGFESDTETDGNKALDVMNIGNKNYPVAMVVPGPGSILIDRSIVDSTSTEMSKVLIGDQRTVFSGYLKCEKESELESKMANETISVIDPMNSTNVNDQNYNNILFCGKHKQTTTTFFTHDVTLSDKENETVSEERKTETRTKSTKKQRKCITQNAIPQSANVWNVDECSSPSSINDVIVSKNISDVKLKTVKKEIKKENKMILIDKPSATEADVSPLPIGKVSGKGKLKTRAIGWNLPDFPDLPGPYTTKAKKRTRNKKSSVPGTCNTGNGEILELMKQRFLLSPDTESKPNNVKVTKPKTIGNANLGNSKCKINRNCVSQTKKPFKCHYCMLYFTCQKARNKHFATIHSARNLYFD